MAVVYKPIDNEHVSQQWYALLIDIREKDHVSFNVNEGHRTAERQQELINEQGLYNSVTNPHGAAPVSPNAPHIRTGRFDHAIDFNNSSGVIAAAQGRGVSLTRTVSTEEWHLEANAVQLEAYFKKSQERSILRRKKISKTKKAIHVVKHRLSGLKKRLGILRNG